MKRGRRPFGRLVPEVLRSNTAFRRFWVGQTVSLFGDQITLVALPLVAVLVLHAGPTAMGYLTAAGVAPNLIFAIAAGAWVDRRGRRRRVMITADIGRALLLLTIPVAYAIGALSIGQLYVVSFLVGTMSVFFFVAYSTLFVSLVPPDDYVDANSALFASRGFSFVAGPSVAGVLVQLLSAPAALLTDAASFVASAASLGAIAPEEPATSDSDASGVGEGIRFIRRSPIVRTALLATATINLFNYMLLALFFLYAVRSLGLRPATLGLVLGIGAIGGIVGSVGTPRLTRKIGVGPAFVLGAILFPAPLVLVPLAAGPTPLVLSFLFAAEFGAGVGVMVLDISIGSIFAAVIPDDLRARVSGAYMTVNYGVRPVGAIMAGLLGAAIGLHATLWIAALGALTGVLWLVRSPVRSLRTLPAGAAERQAS